MFTPWMDVKEDISKLPFFAEQLTSAVDRKDKNEFQDRAWGLIRFVNGMLQTLRFEANV